MMTEMDLAAHFLVIIIIIILQLSLLFRYIIIIRVGACIVVYPHGIGVLGMCLKIIIKK
jgi:hypothetical protein